MNSKKEKTWFTIHFSQSDPAHLQVADILNQQKRYSKAQYIVDAVMHYIGCGLNESAAHQVQLDEKYIEKIVNRILLDRDSNIAGSLTAPTSQVEIPLPSKSQQNTYKLNFGEAMEAISEEGAKAVTEALASFRKK